MSSQMRFSCRVVVVQRDVSSIGFSRLSVAIRIRRRRSVGCRLLNVGRRLCHRIGCWLRVCRLCCICWLNVRWLCLWKYHCLRLLRRVRRVGSNGRSHGHGGRIRCGGRQVAYNTQQQRRIKCHEFPSNLIKGLMPNSFKALYSIKHMQRVAKNLSKSLRPSRPTSPKS